MRQVSVVGIGETKFGKLLDASLRCLVREAGNKAIKDSNIDKSRIQALYLGNYNGSFFSGQSLMGALATEELELPTIPSVRVEAACASGGSAFRLGYLAILSGLYDVVLVGGVEKMTHKPGNAITQGIASAMDYDTETSMGLTFPGLFAMIAHRYFQEYRNVKREMGMCAVNAHRNATMNPDAQLPKHLELEHVLQSPMIADPLSQFDCSLVTDGAAFVVLAADDALDENNRARSIPILGSGQAGDRLRLASKASLTSFQATRDAAGQAYQMAGLCASDIDFAEVHDCFTITQIINTEDLGFFEAGKGADAVAEGVIGIDGAMPINSSGGLKAKGHPIGATGISQIYEIVTQLRGDAGDRQIKKADIGLAHNLGGAAAACVVHILGRR